AKDILPFRKYVVVLAVKPQDPIIEKFRKEGYRVIYSWPPRYSDDRVVLWIKPKHIYSGPEQTAKIALALDDIYSNGGWTVYFDESGYISSELRLHGHLGVLLNQGRSSDITVVTAMTQAKSLIARVPTETLKQCYHRMLFKTRDEREQKAMAEICGISFQDMREFHKILSDHDFLYVGPRDEIIIVRG
ncbi:MAG TPA: hypothetical protein VFK47_21665, partial [Ktedonobacteraceae bacterium]|nr:hypothetical protein [Ktedonobacteraceae bacterium]